MFYVYVLYSPKYSKIYIGFTSDLANRLKSHNELSKKGWTIKYRPWQIVYTEQYNLEEEARANERRLKGAKGREWIWSLINKKIEEGLISA
jgi:putative endonuclease